MNRKGRKMKTTEDINLIRQEMNSDEADKTYLYVHMGTCGIASGAMGVLAALKNRIKEENASKSVQIITTGCAGICSQEPLVTVKTPGTEPVIYKQMNEEKVLTVYDKHVKGNTAVEEYALAREWNSRLKKESG